MSILTRVANWFGGGGPRAANTLASYGPEFKYFVTGQMPGEPQPAVNEWTALNYLAVYNCVSLIASTASSLPLITYRRRANRGKDRATDLGIYRILHDEFNPSMTSATARESGMGHLLTWGNSYAQIVWNKSRSEVVRLQPLGPDVVAPELAKNKRELVYVVKQRGTGEEIARLEPRDVLHVPGLSFDGLIGYSPIRVAKTAIRAGMASDREAERFVSRGIRAPGAVKFPPGRKFKDEADAQKWRDGFRRIHASEDGALQVVVLEDGADWVQLGIDPESAQLLEGRKYSALEICGMYRVPPHLVGLIEKVTSWGTGIEELVAGFIKFALIPWLVKIEQEYNRKLFVGSEDLHCEHLLEGLERADLAKRTAAYEKWIQFGIINPNEARERENLNPRPAGDNFYYPLTLGRTDEGGEDLAPPAAAEPDAPAAPSPPAGQLAGLARSLRKSFIAGVARCLVREAENARAWTTKPSGFVELLDKFYARHQQMVFDRTGTILDAWSAAFGSSPWENYAAEHVARSRAELLAAAECKASELPAAVESVLMRWQTDRLAEVSDQLQPGEVCRAV